jgi:dihydrofolate reductase
MSDVIIEMSMSLDGYISGPNDSDVNPIGDGGERLHTWMFGGDGDGPGEGLTGADKEIMDELRSETGAMISGRRLYDITHGWNGSHPFGGIPVFVVTRNVPDEIPSGSTPFTFVTDGIASAVGQAREVADSKNVYVIGGASIDQQLLAAGLADELRIDVVPILLGGGIRLFADLGPQQIKLERTSVVESPLVTHLRFRVIREAAP